MKDKMEEDTISQLTAGWHGLEGIQIADGYDMKTVPALTMENMNVLMEKINELIIIINELKHER